VPRQPQDKPGLQPQGTALSWERSTIGLLAIGAVLLLRQAGTLTVGRTLLAATACCWRYSSWASVTGGDGGPAQSMSSRHVVAGENIVPDARTEVLLIGWAVAGFATATLVLLLML
jgi:hypothetical protein